MLNLLFQNVEYNNSIFTQLFLAKKKVNISTLSYTDKKKEKIATMLMWLWQQHTGRFTTNGVSAPCLLLLYIACGRFPCADEKVKVNTLDCFCVFMGRSRPVVCIYWAVVGLKSVFFIFAFFKKKITEIYFWIQVLQFYTPAARQGAAGGLPSGRWAVGTYI